MELITLIASHCHDDWSCEGTLNECALGRSEVGHMRIIRKEVNAKCFDSMTRTFRDKAPHVVPF